jgi:hypothetical protein
VQQEHQRGGASRPVGRRHVEVIVACGAEHKWLQTDRRLSGYLHWTRLQTSLRLHIFTRHKLSSIPATLSGYTATMLLLSDTGVVGVINVDVIAPPPGELFSEINDNAMPSS